MRALILGMLILISGAAFAQVYEAPILHCLQVDPNDDVTITWQAPANSSGSLIEYRIFRKEEFSIPLVGIIPFPITSFTEPATLANDEQKTYCVEAVYDSSGFEVIRTSNFLNTMLLGANPQLNSYVNLDWTRPTSSIDSLMYSLFTIQMNHTGAWETIFSTNYSDTIAVYEAVICIETTYDFRVITEDIYGCTSISSQQTATLIDFNVPSAPIIETVSIDTAQQEAIVCWFPVPEPDIAYYTIQYDHPNTGFWQVDAGVTPGPIPTELLIDGPLSNNLEYRVDLQPVSFVVLAHDLCQSPMNPLGNSTSFFDCEPHSTIYLQAEFEKCNRSTALTWNPYIGWDGGVANYVLFGRPGGGNWTVLDTIPADQTNYMHIDVPLAGSYQYMIKALAVNSDLKPSLSIFRGVNTSYPETPDFTYLANVSVTGTKQVELRALIEPAAEGTRYRFEKLNRFGDEFNELVTVLQSSQDADGFITLYDDLAFPSSTIHSYRVISIDSCANEHAISQVSSNILASLEIDNAARQNTIIWPPYGIWAGNVLAYNIFRVNNGVTGDLLATVPAAQGSFVHDVSSDEDYIQDAQYCYLIEAIEGPQALGASQVSHSNIVCGAQEPLMYVPNAFTPNGDEVNDTFGPIAGYLDRNDEYRMTIYDRWGHVMYETDNFYKTWSGEDEDGFVQEGVYVYSIRFRTGGGELFEQNGTVMVLFPTTE